MMRASGQWLNLALDAAGLPERLGPAIWYPLWQALGVRLTARLAPDSSQGDRLPLQQAERGRWRWPVPADWATDWLAQARQQIQRELEQTFGPATASQLVWQLWLEGEDGNQRLDRGSSSWPTADELLQPSSITTLLQPIVRFGDGQIVGFEALSRGPQGSAWQQPDALFAAARATDCLVDLELHCARLALQRTRGRLPPGCWLSLNLGPAALTRAARELDFSAHPDLVIELTEHLPLDETRLLRPALQRLRDKGARIALDDTGCGYADLATACQLRPEIVKLCITVIREASRHGAALAVLRQSVSALQGLGAQVLAEGVETPEQVQALQDCGLALAQGWYYGRPALLDSWLAVPSRRREVTEPGAVD